MWRITKTAETMRRLNIRVICAGAEGRFGHYVKANRCRKTRTLGQCGQCVSTDTPGIRLLLLLRRRQSKIQVLHFYTSPYSDLLYNNK